MIILSASHSDWCSIRVFKVFSEYLTISRKNNILHFVGMKLLFLECLFNWATLRCESLAGKHTGEAYAEDQTATSG